MRRLAFLLLLPLAACDGGSRTGVPATEFVVAAGDSSFWVRTAEGKVELVRRAPLVLARVDGRFYELFVTDADRSFADAVFVGQRLWRRDLVTNDSMVLFEDSVVPRRARAWARRHPDDVPLAPDEDENEHPAASITADVEVVDVLGGYVTYESYADLHDEDGSERHEVRRGVVDLRTGRPVTLANLVGDTARVRLVVAGRTALGAVFDSVRARRDPRARRAARALHGFAFDEESFALTALGREPGIAFLVPGRGAEAGGLAVPLPPLAAPVRSGWRAAREQLPEPVAGSRMVERWTRDGLEVLARYDAAETQVELVLRHAGGDVRVGRLPAPASRLFWLDHPPLDDRTREALLRAFADADIYGEELRDVSAPAVPRARSGGAVLLAANRPATSRTP